MILKDYKRLAFILTGFSANSLNSSTNIRSLNLLSLSMSDPLCKVRSTSLSLTVYYWFTSKVWYNGFLLTTGLTNIILLVLLIKLLIILLLFKSQFVLKIASDLNSLVLLSLVLGVRAKASYNPLSNYNIYFCCLSFLRSVFSA